MVSCWSGFSTVHVGWNCSCSPGGRVCPNAPRFTCSVSAPLNERSLPGCTPSRMNERVGRGSPRLFSPCAVGPALRLSVWMDGTRAAASLHWDASPPCARRVPPTLVSPPRAPWLGLGLGLGYKRALSVTQRALSVTQRALSVTQQALSVTQRALSVTQRALSVTQRALSASVTEYQFGLDVVLEPRTPALPSLSLSHSRMPAPTSAATSLRLLALRGWGL
jgi:hypothetical protein